LFGKGEVHHSTGTAELRLAKVVAGELGARWHARLLALDRMDPQKISAGSLTLLADGFIALDEACAELGTSRLVLVNELLRRKKDVYVYADGWEGWVVSDLAELPLQHDEHPGFELDVSESVLRSVGSRRSFFGELAVHFKEEVRALALTPAGHVSVFRSARGHANTGFIPDSPGKEVSSRQLLVRTSDVEAIRLAFKAVLDSAPPGFGERKPLATSVGTHRHSTMLLSELTRQYLERNRASWRPDTESQNKKRASIFVELSGDPAIGSIDRELLWRIVSELKRIPADRHLVKRAYKVDTEDMASLVRLADHHDLPRLTPKAVRKLMDGFGEILAWAVTQTFLPSNPATNLGEEVFRALGGKKVKATDERDAFSRDDLQGIFGAEWFLTGQGQRTASGVFYYYRPYYYWLPLLALYTGGRLNELAQLYVKDIVVGVEIPHVDFNLIGEKKLDADSHDKSLKTVNATRIVPVHSSLIEKGFLDYVSALQAAGHSRLFPELNFDPVKGYGKAAGSWFNERYLGKRLKIERNGSKTFHSFRHNFSTALGDAGVSSRIRSQLLGHSKGSGEGDLRYDKGRALGTLKEAVESLRYDLPTVASFNVESGLEAAEYATALKISRKPGSA
jgi:integrase